MALEVLDESLLQKCDVLSGPIGSRTVDFINEGIEAMYLLSECAARQAKLVEYLRPLVREQKGVQK